MHCWRILFGVMIDLELRLLQHIRIQHDVLGVNESPKMLQEIEF